MIQVILDSKKVVINSDFIFFIERLENGNDKIITINNDVVTNLEQLKDLITKNK